MLSAMAVLYTYFSTLSSCRQLFGQASILGSCLSEASTSAPCPGLADGGRHDWFSSLLDHGVWQPVAFLDRQLGEYAKAKPILSGQCSLGESTGYPSPLVLGALVPTRGEPWWATPLPIGLQFAELALDSLSDDAGISCSSSCDSSTAELQSTMQVWLPMPCGEARIWHARLVPFWTPPCGAIWR
jgi:hypothetical protein